MMAYTQESLVEALRDYSVAGIDFKTAIKKPIEILFLTYEQVVEMYKKDHLLIVLNSVGPTRITSRGSSIDGLSHFVLETLESQKFDFTDKDVLIIGVDGEMYACKKDIFDKTYDVVDL